MSRPTKEQEIRRDLIEQLAAVRFARGMTQEALAERSGISKGYISNLEAGGRASPKMGRLCKIVAALGVRLVLEEAR